MRRRRAMLGGVAAAGLAAGAWRGWPQDGAPVPGRLVGAGSATGHLLRGPLPEPVRTERAEVVIVGGGMAGLSAAWWLRRLGVTGVTVLELEAEPGGNAASGRNAVSAYPWGAHYVPPLTREATHAALLFEELGIITGRTPSGEPVYDEFSVCADPHERLFRYGRWQDDLVPQLGTSDEDRRQYAGFFAAMEAFRTARGTDGRRAFAIPVELSSSDERFRALDRLTMAGWMRAQGWDSAPLHWYADYCCRDDFGTRAADVSAWAGIHYFAARDSRGQDDQPVLTWPDGNGHIVRLLQDRAGAAIATGTLAWRVRGATVDVFDPARQESRRIEARAVILAVPHFVAARLLGRAPDAAHAYAPWMVANVTLDRMPGGRGAALAWDNVVYGSPSLGYVVATHQALDRVKRRTVLTYYWPLCDQPPDSARRTAFARTLPEWQAMVLDELLRVHPELKGAVRAVDVWVWGHGMIRPAPGYIWGEARQAAARQEPPVFFAHSDMSGISLFEEANYRGVMAAEAAAAFLRA